jgi:hypothetical protein
MEKVSMPRHVWDRLSANIERAIEHLFASEHDAIPSDLHKRHKEAQACINAGDDCERRFLREFTTRADHMTAPGRIVLRDMRGHYAVHWQNLQDGGFYHGSYHQDETNANRAFEARVAKWIKAYGI